MKKIIKFLFLITSVILSLNTAYSQHFVRKIDLYIIPLSTQTGMRIPYNKVKSLATIKITIKESSMLMENVDFLDSIYGLELTNYVFIPRDFRVVCVVHKFIGREILYFDAFGHFLYKNIAYNNETIKLFVFNHIPESCK